MAGYFLGMIPAAIVAAVVVGLGIRYLAVEHYQYEDRKAQRWADRTYRASQPDPYEPEPFSMDGEEIAVAVFVFVVGAAGSWVTLAGGAVAGIGYLLVRLVMILAVPRRREVDK